MLNLSESRNLIIVVVEHLLFSQFIFKTKPKTRCLQWQISIHSLSVPTWSCSGSKKLVLFSSGQQKRDVNTLDRLSVNQRGTHTHTLKVHLEFPNMYFSALWKKRTHTWGKHANLILKRSKPCLILGLFFCKPTALTNYPLCSQEK